MTTHQRRVLLVSSNEGLDIQRLIESLHEAEFTVDRVEDARSARQHIRENGVPHLMVVDLRSPDADGLKLCQELHSTTGLPIITVSSDDDSWESAIAALQHSDDFVRRTVAPEEVVMRIRRILSRINDFSYAKGPEIQVFDWLTVDQVNRQVTVRGESRKLTPTENALLSVLLSHRGKIVDADTLIDRVWRLDPTIKDRNALRVHIHRLRSKIEDDPDDPRIILTERGTGYRFAE
jgi:DNA-binding response OmpR family regulator